MAARGEQHDRGHEEQSKGSLGAEAVERQWEERGPKEWRTTISRDNAVGMWEQDDRCRRLRLEAGGSGVASVRIGDCALACALVLGRAEVKAYNMNTARHGHPGMGRRNGPYKSKEDLVPSVMSWYRTEPASGHLGRTSGSANSLLGMARTVRACALVLRARCTQPRPIIVCHRGGGRGFLP